MSRHRNVRSMNIADEYDYDDVYGHSVEDDYCISPGTVAQFTFNRDAGHNLASYLEPEIPEEAEGAGESDSEQEVLNDSGNYRWPALNELDQARLNSCLEEMRNVIGDSTPEHVLVDSIIKADYNYEMALDSLFNKQEKKSADAPKPQRDPRPNRRNRGADFKLKPPPASAKVNNAASNSSPVRVTNASAISDNVARMTFSDGKKMTTGFDGVVDTGSPQRQRRSAENERLQELSDIFDVPMDTSSSSGALSVTTKKSNRNGDAQKSDNVLLTPGKSSSKPVSPPQRRGSVNTERRGSLNFTPERRGSKQIERVDILKELEKRKGGKDLINLVVIGHVDAGKSTLMGHMLYQLGFVGKRAMHKYKQESQKMGKASFAFAWVLDETEEERTRGVTMDVAQTRFQTDTKMVTLLDAPGHKDFIPNMITGAAQADVAILVVNATKGEFETGFEMGGQTREHALLVRSLGVSQVAVAVNKMDTVGWDQTRYKEIVKKLGQFLKQAGFKEADLSFVPCSGLNGENLTECKDDTLKSWYSGPTLIQQIDKFRAPERPMDKPFRMCVADIFKGMGSGFTVTGKIEAGSVQCGDRLLAMPIGEPATVKGIALDEEVVPCAVAGDYSSVTITGLDQDRVNVGSIMCDIVSPIQATTRVRARIVVFNIDVPLTKGFPVVFHYQTLTEQAHIKKLVSQLHKSTGEVIKKRPRCLVKNSNAVIEIELSRPICIELYKDYKDLGRFMLRYGGSTIAAGLVTEILPGKSSKLTE